MISTPKPLPTELIWQIFAFLTPQHALRMRQISKRIQSFARINLRLFVELQNQQAIQLAESLEPTELDRQWILFWPSNYQESPLGLVSIDWAYEDLRGTIPHSITTLSSLTLLDLSNNSLKGSIPPELMQLDVFRTLETW
ncbi:hypothetical protein BDR26DRAFT_889101 [Obelidium mucronatum]|nr:hypothetical protein BDR26DRAFT_889101 [Obelidium mucronatum]